MRRRSIPLVLVLGTVVGKGAGIVVHATSRRSSPSDIPLRSSRQVGPGMGPAIVGTLLITAAATAIAVPLGILGAVYLHEYGGAADPSPGCVRFLANVMTGVPSIVMGLFVYVVLDAALRRSSAFGGALALACLMLPVVIRSTEEMLRLVPDHLREASYALGDPQEPHDPDRRAARPRCPAS